MIDVWILTMVLGNNLGLTSFQFKFYSEEEANIVRSSLRKRYEESYCSITIISTQEQKEK